MRAIWLLGLIIASPLSAQTTTTCVRNGQVTNCTSNSPLPDTNPSWTTLLPKPRTNSAEDQSSARMQYAPQATGSTSQQRRGDAYSQVGSMIAKGDCDGANRLARFYGVKELIDDTAKACKVQ